MNNKQRYIELLRQTHRDGIENLISWLENSDFFEAPASTRYHNSKPGGLVEHSLNVFDELVASAKFDYPHETIILVSLLHDICKANYYTVSERNVKKDGKWTKEPYYAVDDVFPMGHGEKSVIIAMTYINLSEEELAAIRWHMGGFEPKENYSSISNSFTKYPLSLLLHIADLRATYLVEGKDE